MGSLEDFKCSLEAIAELSMIGPREPCLPGRKVSALLGRCPSKWDVWAEGVREVVVVWEEGGAGTRGRRRGGGGEGTEGRRHGMNRRVTVPRVAELDETLGCRRHSPPCENTTRLHLISGSTKSQPGKVGHWIDPDDRERLLEEIGGLFPRRGQSGGRLPDSSASEFYKGPRLLEDRAVFREGVPGRLERMEFDDSESLGVPLSGLRDGGGLCDSMC